MNSMEPRGGQSKGLSRGILAAVCEPMLATKRLLGVCVSVFETKAERGKLGEDSRPESRIRIMYRERRPAAKTRKITRKDVEESGCYRITKFLSAA